MKTVAPTNKTKKPILFTTLGYPGSGKTFFSRRFSKDLRIFHLNSDVIRLEIFPKPTFSREEHVVVFRIMDHLAKELLEKGMSVIYDANSTKRIYRKRLRALAIKAGGRYVLLWFQTSLETALKRIKQRKKLKSYKLQRYHRPIPDSDVFRIKDEEEPPVREPHVILKVDAYNKHKEIVMKFVKTYI